MNTLSIQEFNSLIKEGVTVVDFYANWCEPCKLLGPVFDSVKEELQGEINFIKLDIDNNLELAREFRISSVPTVLIIKNNEIVDSSVGFLPKEILKQRIEKQI